MKRTGARAAAHPFEHKQEAGPNLKEIDMKALAGHASHCELKLFIFTNVTPQK